MTIKRSLFAFPIALFMAGKGFAFEPIPTYNADWPYKVTNHTTDNHSICTVEDPAAFGCDHIIGPETYSNRLLVKPTKVTPLPGEKVCVLPGTYTHAEIYTTHGTEAEPITITNCGGQVEVNAEFRIIQSTHIKLVGNGDQDTLYGFKINGKTKLDDEGNLTPHTASSLSVYDRSRDLEIAYTDMSAPWGRAVLHFNTGAALYDDNGDPIEKLDLITGELFVQTNSWIHHNLVHDSLEGEGIYLGLAGCGEGEFAGGNALENTYVHDNIVIDNGADGIQIGCARKDTLVYNNYVENAGYNPFRANIGHEKGFQFGAGTSGYVFNNYVKDIKSDCFFIGGGTTSEEGRDIALSLYNNIGVECSAGFAFHQTALTTAEANQKFAIANNSLINMKESHFWMSHYVDDTVNVDLKNNLYVDEKANIHHIIVNGENEVGANFNETNPLLFLTNEVAFADTADGDYSLGANSPAIDAGLDASELDVTTDITDSTRSDGYYDLGALEFFGIKGTPDNATSDYERSALFTTSANGKSLLQYYEGDNEASNRVSIAARQHDTLQFQVKAVEGDLNLDAINVQVTAASQGKLVSLANYLSELTDEYQLVEIPLADFEFSDGKFELGIFEVGIKTNSSVGTGKFALDEITFVGGPIPFVWHGDDNAVEAVYENSPDKLHVELLETRKVTDYAIQLNASSNGKVYLTDSTPYPVITESLDTLTMTVKSLSGDLNLDGIRIGMKAGGHTVELPLANYISTLTTSPQTISVPFTDFAFNEGKLDVGIYQVGIKTTSSVGEGSFALDEVAFTGAANSYLWYGDANRDRAESLWMSNPTGLSASEAQF